MLELTRKRNNLLEYFLDRKTWIKVLGWRAIAYGITVGGFGGVGGFNMKKTLSIAVGVEVAKFVGLYLYLKWWERNHGHRNA